MPRDELPVVGQSRSERADAAANSERILRAAERLLGAGEPVTMGDVAAAAGVGRATLYRRFDSVEAIATSLLDRREREVQEQMISGPPPLGPGADAVARLHAFYDAMLELLEVHAPLLVVSESGAGRFETGAYRVWRTHVRAILRESGTAGADCLADVLLAPLEPALFVHVVTSRRRLADLRRALHALADAVLRSSTDRA